MAADNWQTKRFSVTGLFLDAKNPRLGRETSKRAPREIIQYLFEHDKALEVAESIATRGYFPNEPLLVIREKDRHVVVEGNRRLAALKALHEPALLEGRLERQIERLARRVTDPELIARVPVIIAPSRRATDRQIAGRHIGTPVLAWQAENRASFILEKLDEGYDNKALLDELGFSAADIQKARQTRAIADMARSLQLPEEVMAKIENPRAKLFTTIERVLDSSAGRDFFKIKSDADHGIRGTTTRVEFARAFSKLVTEVALGKQSSRTLNTNDDIRKYLSSWGADERPQTKQGTFVPSDLIKGRSVASSARKSEVAVPAKNAKQISKTVLPRDFKVRYGNDRLIDIHRELTKLKRADFPNAGAVLLRVFFELAVMNYLERTGELAKLIEELKAKGKMPHSTPAMRQIIPVITRIAKRSLSDADATKVEKAMRNDPAAPFTLNDLHAFVHQSGDLPGERDILQFWLRTEPLFRLMLETDVEDGKE
jgi:hypothetical protein